MESHAGKLVYKSHGVVSATASAPLPERLQTIFDGLRAAIGVLKPEVMAVEGVFTHKNARSALILGHARGVALLLAAQFGLSVHEYSPARVKRAVGAGGNDGKDAVARMVTLHLKLTQPLQRADAYDALAIAICHANASRSLAPKLKASALEQFSQRLKPGIVRA